MPEWDAIYGSGGRAAAALASEIPGIELHAYCESSDIADFEAMLGIRGVDLRATESQQAIGFSYFHPLSRPEISWDPTLVEAPIRVTDRAVLRFGFMEGDAIVDADKAVFDPQSSGVRFEANGSKAAAVATVLNDAELLDLTNISSVMAGATALLESGGPDDVVVVKRGARGAEVYLRGQSFDIPAYRSEAVFKIGSGDVFSAIFAYHWAVAHVAPQVAADLASRAVAHYVGHRSLPIPTLTLLRHGAALPVDKAPGRVYLAGPFFTTAQRWLIEEARRALIDLGATVFSPFHDVGLGVPEEVAPADLAGLNDCAAVLAILDGGDPGTLYEVGYARARSMPVVCLAENVFETDLTMPRGSGCEITGDFASAVYRAVWASMR